MTPAGSCVRAMDPHERAAIKNDQRNYCSLPHKSLSLSLSVSQARCASLYPNIQPAHTHFHYQVGLMSVFSEYVRSLYHSGWCDYVAKEHPAVYISSFQRRSYERNSQQMFVLSCALVL